MQEKLIRHLTTRLSEVERRLKLLGDSDLRHIRNDIKQVDHRIRLVERMIFFVLATIVAGAVGVILS